MWFQDEARVGQKGSLEYIWAPVGSRPPMVRDNRHDSVYLFGAICHARGVGAAIIMPAANTEAMNEHLKEISTQVSPGAHAVLVCDGAGWHQQGKRLRAPDNITLLPLPPYSPELNPMENIWDYLRGNKLSRSSGTAMRPSSPPARMRGTSSSAIRSASIPSPNAPGHGSMFNIPGIMWHTERLDHRCIFRLPDATRVQFPDLRQPTDRGRDGNVAGDIRRSAPR